VPCALCTNGGSCDPSIPPPGSDRTGSVRWPLPRNRAATDRIDRRWSQRRAAPRLFLGGASSNPAIGTIHPRTVCVPPCPSSSLRPWIRCAFVRLSVTGTAPRNAAPPVLVVLRRLPCLLACLFGRWLGRFRPSLGGWCCCLVVVVVFGVVWWWWCCLVVCLECTAPGSNGTAMGGSSFAPSVSVSRGQSRPGWRSLPPLPACYAAAVSSSPLPLLQYYRSQDPGEGNRLLG